MSISKFLSHIKLFAFTCLFLIGALWISSFIAFADDVGSVVIPDSQFIMDLLASVGGIKGASSMAIAVVVVQLAMKALQTPFFGNLAGKYRLLAVYGLSMAAGVLGLMVSGVPLAAALLHANTLAALQVLANQAYKQFIVKQD